MGIYDEFDMFVKEDERHFLDNIYTVPFEDEPLLQPGGIKNVLANKKEAAERK